MSEWMEDEREIASVKLAGNGTFYHRIAAATFERFERPGEYCMLPWIRIVDAMRGKEIEAPLTQVELIEFNQ